MLVFVLSSLETIENNLKFLVDRSIIYGIMILLTRTVLLSCFGSRLENVDMKKYSFTVDMVAENLDVENVNRSSLFCQDNHQEAIRCEARWYQAIQRAWLQGMAC